MTTKWGRILPGVCIVASAFTAAAQQQMPRTTKENIPGAQSLKLERLKGTVLAVDGNHLAVKMSTGEIRTFDVPSSRRFQVDGKVLTVGELKPGTTLTATVTTITAQSTDRTTTVASGRVWYVTGNTVILTLPNNENRLYKVDEDYRFTVNGQKASVHDLRKGMVIAAEKITEEPKTEIASNTTVIGEAPPAAVPAAPKLTAIAPDPKPSAMPRHTPAPVHMPAPVTASPPPSAERSREAEPAELPKTASQTPLIGAVGLVALTAWLFMRRMRKI